AKLCKVYILGCIPKISRFYVTNNNLMYTLLYSVCLEALRNDICKSSSEAITSIYKQAFVTKTRLDGRPK
ncbi:43055_t:CDS:2, partial [Gigaspora margarita]